MEGISNSLLYSPTVQTYMNLQDPLAKILMDNEIISVFSNTMTLKDNIRGIQLFDKEGTMINRIGTVTGETVQLPVETTVYSGLLTDSDTGTPPTTIPFPFPFINLKSVPLIDYRGTGVFVMDVRISAHILKGRENNEKFPACIARP